MPADLRGIGCRASELTLPGAWKRIIRICKAHGLNHIRFHSWCPPEAAYLPRQDQSNGRIDQFEIFVSMDGQKWSEPVASGTWPDDRNLKTVRFALPQNARYVKLEAGSEVRGQIFASAAEVNVLLGDGP